MAGRRARRGYAVTFIIAIVIGNAARVMRIAIGEEAHDLQDATGP